jgi:hypothetical protein
VTLIAANFKKIPIQIILTYLGYGRTFASLKMAILCSGVLIEK